MSVRYPYARPDVTEADIRAVSDSLRGQFLTQGPKLGEFEAALAGKLGAKYAVVCNSGTAALHLAYLALRLGADSALLTSPVTFLATANAARMCGADVIFADVDPVTGNLTSESVRRTLDAAEQNISALCVVHLGGRACDVAAIREITARKGVALVEDACHAPLASYSSAGKRYTVGACAHSDIAAFSFHPIKHVAMGEGGAVLTNDVALAERARLFRNHGMIRDSGHWQNAPEPNAPWYYEMHEIGWNYRASEMQCALGLSQLSRLEGGIRRRREIAARYDELLSGLNHLTLPMHDEGHVWHLYAVAIDFEAVGKTRGRVMTELAARGIGTQVHYIPINSQPYYRGGANGETPNASRYYERTLSIPMYVGLTDSDVEIIAAGIRDVISAH
jgi:UDP-4-amino-4,6-dideoxy-N-acetyl-beta-L-altrosamine transaminase